MNLPLSCPWMYNQVSMNKSCDILIIGGGIAGLRAALTASNFGSVYLLTKGKIGETATERAQGGIAAAIDKIQDSTQYHFEDTIDAVFGYEVVYAALSDEVQPLFAGE